VVKKGKPLVSWGFIASGSQRKKRKGKIYPRGEEKGVPSMHTREPTAYRLSIAGKKRLKRKKAPAAQCERELPSF